MAPRDQRPLGMGTDLAGVSGWGARAGAPRVTSPFRISARNASASLVGQLAGGELAEIDDQADAHHILPETRRSRDVMRIRDGCADSSSATPSRTLPSETRSRYRTASR